jgi:hypothetical protein
VRKRGLRGLSMMRGCEIFVIVFLELCASLFLESRARRAKKSKGFLDLGSWLGSKLAERILLFPSRQVGKENWKRMLGSTRLLLAELHCN